MGEQSTRSGKVHRLTIQLRRDAGHCDELKLPLVVQERCLLPFNVTIEIVDGNGGSVSVELAKVGDSNTPVYQHSSYLAIDHS